jgi:uncharacterized protein with GYD domain
VAIELPVGRAEVSYASYSNAGIKGIIDKPADRTEAIKALVDAAGGKLLAAYMMTGPHDVVIVTEQADGSDAVAIGMAAAASGAAAKIETVRAWTVIEFRVRQWSRPLTYPRAMSGCPKGVQSLVDHPLGQPVQHQMARRQLEKIGDNSR